MFSFEDVKMMYDWGCFTDDQVRQFVPLCITNEEAEKIVNTENYGGVLKRVRFLLWQKELLHD